MKAIVQCIPSKSGILSNIEHNNKVGKNNSCTNQRCRIQLPYPPQPWTYGPIYIWVRSRCQMIAKPDNKTAAPSWLDPYEYTPFCLPLFALCILKAVFFSVVLINLAYCPMSQLVCIYTILMIICAVNIENRISLIDLNLFIMFKGNQCERRHSGLSRKSAPITWSQMGTEIAESIRRD